MQLNLMISPTLERHQDITRLCTDIVDNLGILTEPSRVSPALQAMDLLNEIQHPPPPRDVSKILPNCTLLFSDEGQEHQNSRLQGEDPSLANTIISLLVKHLY